jgi:hypothetical protein
MVQDGIVEPAIAVTSRCSETHDTDDPEGTASALAKRR